jgi:hypothetical protein
MLKTVANDRRRDDEWRWGKEDADATKVKREVNGAASFMLDT